MTAPSAGEPRPLTIDRLVLELARERAGLLAYAGLLEYAARLALEDELIERRTAFAPESYARNLVFRTPDVELLVLCWRPGQGTTIHDHAGSLNAIRVHRGELTSRLYARAATADPGRGPVELASEELVPAGALTGLDRDGIHQLVNLSDRDLVTIHLYAPPLKDVTVYSTADGAVERRPLRYTMTDDIA